MWNEPDEPDDDDDDTSPDLGKDLQDSLWGEEE